MCGIVGFVSREKRDDPASFLVESLRRLEYRGYDSWGIAFGKDPFILRKVGKISELPLGSPELAGINYPARAGLAHTRWATHGGVTDANAHPQVDCRGKVAVVHNGIIENWESLQKDLSSKGHLFRSGTDTEVAAHLVEDSLPGKEFVEDRSLVEAVRRSFNKLEGLNAVAVFFPERDLIVAFKNGSSLMVGICDDELLLASDVTALLPYTRKAVFLKDGQGAVLKKDGLLVMSAGSGKESEVKVERVSWSAKEAARGEYPHFLIKEIKEQPYVLGRLREYPGEILEEVGEFVKNSYGTYLTACGTAAHAGVAATYLFSDIAKRHVNFAVGSEFYFLKEFLTPRSLLIAASQSGETMDTLEAVRAAKRCQAKVVAFANVPGSSLTRLADRALMLNCGPEKAVLATKSYTAKLALFLLLSYQLAGRLDSGRKVISQVAKSIPELFSEDYEQRLLEVAGKLAGEEHLYCVGRGVNYATALEAALKIKEASYLHAEGFAGGELKHGVIALVEKGTPCLVFVANDKTKSSILANAEELKSRGGFIVGISQDKLTVFDEWLPVPDIKNASAIVNIIPAQLLAYFLALERGLDPDKPRNLAKSVTVK